MEKRIIINAESLEYFLEDEADLCSEKYDALEVKHKFYDEITKTEIPCEKVQTRRFRMRVNDYKVVISDETRVYGRVAVNYYVLGYRREHETDDSKYVECAREKKYGVFHFSVLVKDWEYCKDTLEIEVC